MSVFVLTKCWPDHHLEALVAVLRLDAGGDHVGAADGLDLLHTLEPGLVEEVVKVADDLVQEADTLQTLVVHSGLHVKLLENIANKTQIRSMSSSIHYLVFWY